MAKVWLIAQHHFFQEVRKRTFIIVLFSLPLFLAVSVGAGYLAARLEHESTTLGYVDQAGLLAGTSEASGNDQVRLVAFETPEAARQALDSGEIDAYYVLKAVSGTRRADLVFFKSPEYEATKYFDDVVRRSLLAGQPPTVVQRVLSGPTVTVRAVEQHRDFPSGGPGASQVMLIIVAAIFAFLVMTTSGYMMEVVVAEKENRTMEIVASSVSTTRLMTGKIIGAAGIALIQLAVWVACLAGAVWLGGSVLNIEWLQNVSPSWRDILMIVIVALPTYLFLGALTTMVGSTLVDSQEAHQMGGFSLMLLFIPLYLLLPISQSPNGTLSLGMSFFPLTSVVTIAMRSLFMEVPVWQIALSASIALASALVTVWLAGKVFRISMLRYGQRLKFRELLWRRSPAAPVDSGQVQAARRV